MADYLAYGFSAYEIEVKNHIIVRVSFAISVSNRPAWRAFGQLILRQLQLPIRRGKSEA
jgi:hypothetical protein